MVGFLRIVLFLTFLNLILADSCDPNHGKEGIYDCVRIPRYAGYQWAICLSSQTLKTQTSGQMACQESFCWLPCTQSIYPKSKRGNIPKECKCDPVENERRKKSLIEKGGESTVKVPAVCYIPSLKNNCQWYLDCLGTHSQCEGKKFSFAISYGKAICSIFLKIFDSLSQDAKSWIISSKNCIENRMRSILMPNNTYDCKNIRDRAYKVFSFCYVNGKPPFCKLHDIDQQRIYWSIKQFYEHAFKDEFDTGFAFSEKFDEVMAKFQSCLRLDIYGFQRKFMFYVERDSDENINENEFARALVEKFKFSSHGIDWDIDKTFNSRKRREDKKRKGYQIVGIFVSRKEVAYIERAKKSPDQPHLRKTLDNEYDTIFLDSLNYTLTNGFTNDALGSLNIKKWRRDFRIVGLAGAALGIAYYCFKPLIIGCFRSTSRALFQWMREGVLPDTPGDIDPRFYLHSVKKAETQLSFSDVSSLNSVDVSRNTFIIVHGYLSNGKKPWISDMSRAILSKEEANVIVVDWGKGADHFFHYEQAAVNTEVVGTIIALLVRLIELHHGAEMSYIHIIGHSLGAHVAGYAGKAQVVTKYDRITGLDPAGPFFNGKDKDERLDKTDAHFVDVIHTNAGSSLPKLGYLRPIGHLDFYPNGGSAQPHCSSNRCSHTRAQFLFTVSIEANENFLAFQCPTLRHCKNGKTGEEQNRMGFYAKFFDSEENRMFYLKTDLKSPYDAS